MENRNFVKTYRSTRTAWRVTQWTEIPLAERTCLLGLEVFRLCTNVIKSALQASSEQHVRAVLSRFASLNVPYHSHILVLQRLARFLLYASHSPSYSGQAVKCDIGTDWAVEKKE
jgi:hypothetical protein